MPFSVRIHYDNAPMFGAPHAHFWYPGLRETDESAPTEQDGFGPIFHVLTREPRFFFKFKDGTGLAGPWEGPSLDRVHEPLAVQRPNDPPAEIWVRGDRAFVYRVEPRAPEAESAEEFLRQLPVKHGTYIPGTGGFSGLGAHVLVDGRVLFGLYHPNAARVHVMGSFNDWQRPNHDRPDPSKFIECRFYRGYFGLPNTWLAVVEGAAPGDEYKFFVQGGVPRDDKRRAHRYTHDPHARRLSGDFSFNNPVIIDPTTYRWGDEDWRTPDPSQLILYELSVYGFTESDPDIREEDHGSFRGITERIRQGYFERVGITALSLMPLAEFSSVQAPDTLGYNPSLFCTVERDFGEPDDLRELVDTAHQHGLAVLLDNVFNHTDNDFNPLWQMILEHPGEETNSTEGGLYFNGSTPWGNRLATEKEDVQNMLIDSCKFFIREYHVDGFRFDMTNHVDRGFLQRLAAELKGFKPDTLLVAENLPNNSDLNRQGFDGYAQWCDQFHDKIKALLREGPFENGQQYNTDNIGDMFYFSRNSFAAHTNNVINYCESHDEHSVAHEVASNPMLNHPAAKERKSRLGLLATMVALGQPMIYMGQEFGVERPRNIVSVAWPQDLETPGVFHWASRLIHLRRRYPGLKVSGYDPEGAGQFVWVLAPWLDGSRGGGRKVIGWRTRPNGLPYDELLVMLNFENHGVTVDVDFGRAGTWVKLADIDRVNDVPPDGTNSAADPTALRTNDGRFTGFVLPSSAGFVYKWEAPL